jgi:hypothetical protein
LSAGWTSAVEVVVHILQSPHAELVRRFQSRVRQLRRVRYPTTGTTIHGRRGGVVSGQSPFTSAGVGTTLIATTSLASGTAAADDDEQRARGRGNDNQRRWRAGDQHIHREYCVGLDTVTLVPSMSIAIARTTRITPALNSVPGSHLV